MRALQEAGTTVCEPVHRFHLEIPSDVVGAVSQALARLKAPLHRVATQVTSSQLVGDIAAARVHELQQQLLPGLTRGEGVLEVMPRNGFVQGERFHFPFRAGLQVVGVGKEVARHAAGERSVAVEGGRRRLARHGLDSIRQPR